MFTGSLSVKKNLNDSTCCWFSQQRFLSPHLTCSSTYLPFIESRFIGFIHTLEAQISHKSQELKSKQWSWLEKVWLKSSGDPPAGPTLVWIWEQWLRWKPPVSWAFSAVVNEAECARSSESSAWMVKPEPLQFIKFTTVTRFLPWAGRASVDAESGRPLLLPRRACAAVDLFTLESRSPTSVLPDWPCFWSINTDLNLEQGFGEPRALLGHFYKVLASNSL